MPHGHLQCIHVDVASSVERLTKKARTKHASGMERLSIRFWIGKVIHLDLAG